MDSLLLEIGVEELPAAYIQPAVEVLSINLSKHLLEASVDHGFIKTFATPRRLAVLVKDVASEQKNIVKQICGPPEKIAFDKNGDYGIAAIKFADKVGATLKQLEVISLDKGRYISIKKTEPGRATSKILQTILPELILSIPFPKKMRWSNLSIYFARPIRTIVALLGTKVIKFVISDRIRSGRNSTGHLFMSTGNVPISHPDHYSDIMEKVSVIVDIETRRNIICEAISKAACKLGGEILNDENLLDIANNLIEFPVVIVGKFDDFFLNMPKEILITVMREHQRYFSVVDKEGNLLPGFIAVTNTFTRSMGVVSVGHERVLCARLSDAMFFYNADIATFLEDWVEKLKGVCFHAELGSMHDRISRLEIIALKLANMFTPKSKEEVQRSAYLCKADLTSQIVTEFPNLQGIMGAIYARAAGESEKVCLAIHEHYRPIKSGGELVKTKIGAIIAISDKIDSICGCFCIGLFPKGNYDPYALRRKAIGLLRTIRHMDFDLTLEGLVQRGLEQYNVRKDLTILVEKICGFLKNRFFQLLLDEGHSSDIIGSIINMTPSNIIDLEIRINALEKFKKTNNFISVSMVFKRIDNLLRKSEPIQTDVFERLFEDVSEFKLYEAYLNVNKKVKLLIRSKNVYGALEEIVFLCDPIDLFFDKVMVMVEDKEVCFNRLALLASILGIFYRIADFSQIST